MSDSAMNMESYNIFLTALCQVDHVTHRVSLHALATRSENRENNVMPRQSNIIVNNEFSMKQQEQNNCILVYCNLVFVSLFLGLPTHKLSI